MGGGAWKAVVHGVTKSQTRLSDFTFTFHIHALEEEMATHSSVLAWGIPGTAEPGAEYKAVFLTARHCTKHRREFLSLATLWSDKQILPLTIFFKSSDASSMLFFFKLSKTKSRPILINSSSLWAEWLLILKKVCASGILLFKMALAITS